MKLLPFLLLFASTSLAQVHIGDTVQVFKTKGQFVIQHIAMTKNNKEIYQLMNLKNNKTIWALDEKLIYQREIETQKVIKKEEEDPEAELYKFIESK